MAFTLYFFKILISFGVVLGLGPSSYVSAMHFSFLQLTAGRTRLAAA